MVATPFLLVSVLLLATAFPAYQQIDFLKNVVENPPQDDDNPIEANYVDSDGDGWSDEVEVLCGSNPLDNYSMPDVVNFDDYLCEWPWPNDDLIEFNYTDLNSLGIDLMDSDNDGWSDYYERLCLSDVYTIQPVPWLDVSVFPQDVDKDGTCDTLDGDVDGDGFENYYELECGSSLINPNSIPLTSNISVVCDGKQLISEISEFFGLFSTIGIPPHPSEYSHNQSRWYLEYHSIKENSTIYFLNDVLPELYSYHWDDLDILRSGNISLGVEGNIPTGYFSLDIWNNQLLALSLNQSDRNILLQIEKILNNQSSTLERRDCGLVDLDMDYTCDIFDLDDDGDGYLDIVEIRCGYDSKDYLSKPNNREHLFFECAGNNSASLNDFCEELSEMSSLTLQPEYFSTYYSNWGSSEWLRNLIQQSEILFQNTNFTPLKGEWHLTSSVPPSLFNSYFSTCTTLDSNNIFLNMSISQNSSIDIIHPFEFTLNVENPHFFKPLAIHLLNSDLVRSILPTSLVASKQSYWEGVARNFVLDSDFDSNFSDPQFPSQWYLLNNGSAMTAPHSRLKNSGTVGEDLNLTSIWGYYDGAGVKIAYSDVGFDFRHRDLWGVNYTWDYIENDQNVTLSIPPGWASNTDATHGTNVLSIMMAEANNSQGIVGVSPGSIYDVFRVWGDQLTSQYISDRMNATDIYLNARSPFSFRDYSNTTSMLENISYRGRNSLGSIIVTTAGNKAEKSDSANYNEIAVSRYSITVGAIDNNGSDTPYSEFGSNIFVVAYGGIDRSAVNCHKAITVILGEFYTCESGTSFAAPQVAGVVALMLEANSNLTWRDVQHLLAITAKKNDPTNESWAFNGAGMKVSHDYGFGVVDAGHAVYKALNWTGLPDESNMSAGQYGLSQTIPGNDANWTEIIVELDQTDVQPHKHAFFMESAEVHLDIDHQRRGDLEIRLISPFGTESILSELYNPPDRPSHANGSLNWTFTTVHNWGENALFQYQDLEEDVGKWTIKIRDNSSLNLADGILRGWSLHLHGHEGVDSDGDGYSDYEENRCNSNASDPTDFPINTDGLDWCDFLDDDDDNDGWSDTSEDDCGTDSLDEFDTPSDNDGDGICDSEDSDDDNDGWTDDVEQWCGTDSFSQYSVPSDLDQDGVCDFLDLDIDGDSFNNTYENYCLTNPYYSWEYPIDFDSDGLCDNLDEDDDNDSWNDTYEIDCLSDPLDNLSIPADNDGGGLCDALDNDDDNDLIPDWLDANPLNPGGTEDWLPPRPPLPGTPGAPPPWMDSDDDGVPDWQDPDYWYDEDNSDYPEGTDTSSNPPPWVEGPR